MQLSRKNNKAESHFEKEPISSQNPTTQRKLISQEEGRDPTSNDQVQLSVGSLITLSLAIREPFHYASTIENYNQKNGLCNLFANYIIVEKDREAYFSNVYYSLKLNEELEEDQLSRAIKKYKLFQARNLMVIGGVRIFFLILFMIFGWYWIEELSYTLKTNLSIIFCFGDLIYIVKKKAEQMVPEQLLNNLTAKIAKKYRESAKNVILMMMIGSCALFDQDWIQEGFFFGEFLFFLDTILDGLNYMYGSLSSKIIYSGAEEKSQSDQLSKQKRVLQKITEEALQNQSTEAVKKEMDIKSVIYTEQIQIKRQEKVSGCQDIITGPKIQREAKDESFCILFLLCFVVFVGCIIFYGNQKGNKNNIYRATNSNEDICGEVGGNASEFPFSYFSNPTQSSNRYCVQECPYFKGGSLTSLSCFQDNCTYTVTIDAIGSYSTAPSATDIIGYDSTSHIGRVCIPSATVFSGAFNTTTQTFTAYINQNRLISFITDVENNWQWLLFAFGISIMVSFIFICALRCLTGCIVAFSALGIIFFFTYLVFLILNIAGQISTPGHTQGSLSIQKDGGSVIYKVIGIFLFGLDIFFILLIWYFNSQIRKAVAICKITWKFIKYTWGSILVSVIHTVVNLALWTVCLNTLPLLISQAPFSSQNGDLFTTIPDIHDKAIIKVFLFLVSAFWCNACIQAVGVFVITSTCCNWYYSHGPNKDKVKVSFLNSYKIVIRYHLGSLAFSSPILKIFQFIQPVLEGVKLLFIDLDKTLREQKRQLDDNSTSKRIVIISIISVNFCQSCLDRILKYFNKESFIQIALLGTSFYQAAKKGFKVVWSKPHIYWSVSGIKWIILIGGGMTVAILTTIILYLMIDTFSVKLIGPVYYYSLVFIMSFDMAFLFTTIPSTTIDTIMHCFIIDEANQKYLGNNTAVNAPQDVQNFINSL